MHIWFGQILKTRIEGILKNLLLLKTKQQRFRNITRKRYFLKIKHERIF